MQGGKHTSSVFVEKTGREEVSSKMETHQIPKVPGGEFRYQRRYTKLGVHPYDAVKWETRDAVITDAKAQIIFEQKGVEAPSLWSRSEERRVGKECRSRWSPY